MAADTIFSRIVRREIPADIVYQDDLVTAFRDIEPAAPTHVLVVPNHIIASARDVTDDDEPVLGRMFGSRRGSHGSRAFRRPDTG